MFRFSSQRCHGDGVISMATEQTPPTAPDEANEIKLISESKYFHLIKINEYNRRRGRLKNVLGLRSKISHIMPYKQTF